MKEVDQSAQFCKGQLVDQSGTDPQRVLDELTLNIDLEMLKVMQSRLSIEDVGRLSIQIARAAAAKRPSELQRLLLSIMTHKEGVA